MSDQPTFDLFCLSIVDSVCLFRRYVHRSYVYISTVYALLSQYTHAYFEYSK